MNLSSYKIKMIILKIINSNKFWKKLIQDK